MYVVTKKLPCAMIVFALFFLVAGAVLCAQDFGQEQNSGTGERSRGSIPETLLRPQRGEAPRYPMDTVIGPVGQGEAPPDAYHFARQIGADLAAGNINAPSLFGISRTLLENYVAALQAISPRLYRIGSGREEADGAVSFLIRFAGREQGITGELYIRRTDQPVVQGGNAEQTVRTIWVFEELLLDNPKSQDEENGGKRRFDFSPYERLF